MIFFFVIEWWNGMGRAPIPYLGKKRRSIVWEWLYFAL